MPFIIGPLKTFRCCVCVELSYTTFGGHLKIQNEWTINSVGNGFKKWVKSKAEVIMSIKDSMYSIKILTNRQTPRQAASSIV